MDDTGLINNLEGLPVTIYVTFAAKDGFRSIPHTGTLTTESAKSLIVEFESAGYRRLPEGNHLLPDSERREIIDYLLKSMPGRRKSRDLVEICVRTMSQVCLDKLRGEK